MNTIEVKIALENHLHESCISFLEPLNFDGFWEEDYILKAYILMPNWSDNIRSKIEQWLIEKDQPPAVHLSTIEDQNWNATWESSLKAIEIPPFIITQKQSAQKELIEIIIDPKMSFGSGYHPTTRLMLRFMAKHFAGLDLFSKNILDAGAGTGILAIAALKLGAKSVIAFDIDQWSKNNADTNLRLNNCTDQIDFRLGTIDVIPENNFDIFLANINRNILFDLLPAFKSKTRAGGLLFLAGILDSDKEIMLAKTSEIGFSPIDEASEEGWWSVVLKKTTDY